MFYKNKMINKAQKKLNKTNKVKKKMGKINKIK